MSLRYIGSAGLKHYGLYVSALDEAQVHAVAYLFLST
jgi:hypothetical protein